MSKMKLLAVVLMSLGILFFVAPKTEVSAASKMTLSQLRAKFPHGKYWNHIGSSKNNPDGWTNTPCTHHGFEGSGCSYDGSCGCNSTGQGIYAIQCAGYAYKVGYDAFGINPKTWTKYSGSSGRNYLYNNLKAGDLVRINNDGHSIYITGVSGNTVTYTHCNVNATCKIEWGRTISKSALAAKLTYVRSAPSTFSKYAMDIVYDNEGGSGSILKQMVAYESTFTIPSASKFKKDGYTFDGFYLYRNEDKKYMCEDGKWYSETEITEKNLVKKVYQPKKTLTVSKEWTSNPSKQTKFIFKAKWKPNTYTVSFDANGGEGEMASMQGAHGTEFVMPKGVYLKDKNTFNGYNIYSQTKQQWLYSDNGQFKWLSEEDGNDLELALFTSESVLEGIYPQKDENLVAYAYYVPDTISLRYSCLSHGQVLEDTIVSYGDTVTLAKNTCVKDGYSFKGWQAYSTMLSQKLYSYNGEFVWSDERSEAYGYVPVTFADESEVSFISPISNDVIIMQSVWERNGTGELIIDDYHQHLFTKTITQSLTPPNQSLLQNVIDALSGVLEVIAF